MKNVRDDKMEVLVDDIGNNTTASVVGDKARLCTFLIQLV